MGSRVLWVTLAHLACLAVASGHSAVQRQLKIPSATIKTFHRRQLKLPTDDN
jgi:hypothetical protein